MSKVNETKTVRQTQQHPFTQQFLLNPEELTDDFGNHAIAMGLF